MEAYALAAIPVAAVYLGWITNRLVKLGETQAATVAKLESIVEEHNYLREKVDGILIRG